MQAARLLQLPAVRSPEAVVAVVGWMEETRRVPARVRNGPGSGDGGLQAAGLGMSARPTGACDDEAGRGSGSRDGAPGGVGAGGGCAGSADPSAAKGYGLRLAQRYVLCKYLLEAVYDARTRRELRGVRAGSMTMIGPLISAVGAGRFGVRSTAYHARRRAIGGAIPGRIRHYEANGVMPLPREA